MSDSIKKWNEIQEDKNAKIYESPDGGKTVTERSFYGGTTERKVIKHPVSDIKQKAYKLLCHYDEDVIRMAMKIIDIGD